jgi:hypothetical protein
VFALLDRCPHKGGPLSQGIVFGTSVACPLHNWTIGLDDGCAKAPDEGCTPKFACKVEGGIVLLDPVELATHAIDLDARRRPARWRPQESWRHGRRHVPRAGPIAAAAEPAAVRVR